MSGRGCSAFRMREALPRRIDRGRTICPHPFNWRQCNLRDAAIVCQNVLSHTCLT